MLNQAFLCGSFFANEITGEIVILFPVHVRHLASHDLAVTILSA